MFPGKTGVAVLIMQLAGRHTNTAKALPADFAPGVASCAQHGAEGALKMETKKRKPSSSNQKLSGIKGRFIRFDFPPGATPEAIAKALNEMRERYRKGSDPENPAEEDSSAEKP